MRRNASRRSVTAAVSSGLPSPGEPREPLAVDHGRPPPLSACGPGATAAGFEQDGVEVSKLGSASQETAMCRRNAIFGTPQASSASSRLKLGPSATCDGPRHSGSTPEGAKTHPRSLRSSSAVVHRCRYAPMVRRAESLKLPGDKTLAIAVAVSLVLFAWGLSEFVRSL